MVGSARRSAPLRAFIGWLFGRGGMKRTVLVPFILLLVVVFGASWAIHMRGSRGLLIASADGIARSGLNCLAVELRSFMLVPEFLASSSVARLAVRELDAAVLDDPSFPDIFPAIFVKQLELYPDIDIMAVSFANGEYAEAQRIDGATIRIGRAGVSTGGVLAFFRPGPNGPIPDPAPRVAYDPRQRPWYKAAVSSPALVWSEPYRYVSNGKPAIASALSFRGTDGVVLGVFSITLGLDRLAARLSAMDELAGGGIAAIVDKNGRVVSAGAAGLDSSFAVPPLASLSERDDDVSALLRAVSAGPAGHPVQIAAGGLRWRGLHASFQPSTVDWRLLLALPERRFLAPLENIERRVAGVYLLAFLGALGLAYVIAYQIAAPLRLLGSATRDFDPDAPSLGPLDRLTRRTDEIGRLAASFAALGGRLSANFRTLNTSLEEKNILLKEVHHRVKNNLQIVASLMGLKESESDDPAFVAAMRELQDRVRAMSVVHETLYSSGDFVAVPMDDYLRRVMESLSAYQVNEQSIDLRVIPGGVTLPLDKAIPCGLVAVELAVNAFKHAFIDRDTGVVEVGLAEDDQYRFLWVSDNGRGLSETEKPVGMGSVIVSALASQLRGTFSIGSNGDGTRAEVRFPLAD